ncbi:MAG: MBOAT family protein, partial [Treponema sp.]|nr:MBOAT family protein [Treponema sp.]
IVRYSDVNERIIIRNSTVTNVKAVIKRLVVGFAKKIFLANTVASFADFAFAQWSIMHPLYLWFGAICYSLQIFYDFSAYSDMAIGLGRIIGFDFCENFDSPYISMSMKEFWRRWHISLSQWFRDYVYIPLGGNRRGKVRTCINLVAVFFLTGLWHGAAWQFVFWGLWNGLFLLLERTKFGTFLEKIPKFFRHLYCLVVVLLGWIMFRADSLNNAVGYVKNMFLGNIKSFYNIEALKCMTPFNFFMFLISIIGIIPIFKKVMLKSVESSSVFSEVGYLLLYGLTIIYMSGISYNPFIYFQF